MASSPATTVGTGSADGRIPEILRCCGYRSRRQRRWVGYCLELHLRVEGGSWEELLERLVMSASLHLARLQSQPGARLPGKAPLRIRLLYAYIALLHFLKPRHDYCLADLSSGLLLHEGS